MDATSGIRIDNQNKTLSNMSKIRNTNLHDAIDKVAEKAKPAIDSLAESAHRKVESLAFRAGKLEDTYHNYLGTSKNFIQSHPLMSVGAVMFLSFAVTKLIKTSHK